MLYNFLNFAIESIHIWYLYFVYLKFYIIHSLLFQTISTNKSVELVILWKIIRSSTLTAARFYEILSSFWCLCHCLSYSSNRKVFCLCSLWARSIEIAAYFIIISRGHLFIFSLSLFAFEFLLTHNFLLKLRHLTITQEKNKTLGGRVLFFYSFWMLLTLRFYFCFCCFLLVSPPPRLLFSLFRLIAQLFLLIFELTDMQFMPTHTSLIFIAQLPHYILGVEINFYNSFLANFLLISVSLMPS